MAPHSSTLAWKIPWTEEPGGLQSMGLLRVGHGWATSLSLFISCIGEGNGNPLQCSCLENPRDQGAWWAAVYGVAQSQTQLKRLSSSSSSYSTFLLFCSWLMLPNPTLKLQLQVSKDLVCFIQPVPSAPSSAPGIQKIGWMNQRAMYDVRGCRWDAFWI